MRLILEKFGDRLGPLVRTLRELRLQAAALGRPGARCPTVRPSWSSSPGRPRRTRSGPVRTARRAGTTGVGQLVVHPWGFVVCPVDERATWIHYRRASIATVTMPGPGEW